MTTKTGLAMAILFLLITFWSVEAPGQDTKQEIVRVIVESINQKSIDKLTPHLSENFEISGRVPPISVKILDQLVQQLDEQVDEYDLVKTETNSDGSVTYAYKFMYKGFGEREVSFTVNSQDRITTLELVKMSVKTMEGPSDVQKPVDKVLEIPFQVKEKLMLVQASVNGERKNFIFDSGSPRLILNQVHYRNQPSSEETKYSSLEGVHGNINSLDIFTISNFDFNGIQLRNQKVLTADLSHLEAILETPIAGLIGYEIFEGYDILFNYHTATLMLIQPDQTETFIRALSAQLSKKTVHFELKQHIPLFEASVSNHKLTLGLDSGASSNLLSEDWYKVLKKSVFDFRETNLTGAEGDEEKVKKGNLKKLKVTEIEFDTVPTLFKDISNLKQAYGEEMDGLAGYELLHRQITLVSYSKKMMYLFLTEP